MSHLALKLFLLPSMHTLMKGIFFQSHLRREKTKREASLAEKPPEMGKPNKKARQEDPTFSIRRHHGAIFIKSPFQAVIYLLFPVSRGIICVVFIGAI